MHIQAKSTAAASPANLADFLAVLAEDVPNEGRLNVEGITGCGAETGWGVVFTMHHDHFELGVARLQSRGYTVELNDDIYVEEIVPSAAGGIDDMNRPGVLAEIIQNAKDSPTAKGRPIDTVLVATRTGDPGRFYVQVSFVDDAFFDPEN